MTRKLYVLLLVVAMLAVAVPVTATPPPQTAGQSYVVQPGDTLADLAETALNDRALYPAIAALTNEKAIADSAYDVIGDPQWLEPGWQIYLPTAEEAGAYVAAPTVLRLSTTSSTADTGLLDAILPDFNSNFNAQVDYIAVGTGQAIEMGAKGDVDVVLVHARSREDKFVSDGDGINRLDVMYNDYVVVGPKTDPAGVAGMATAKEAFTQIADKQAPFVSRGDDSGTHTKEKSIWASAAMTPTVDSGWYFSIGQTMGDTLNFTNEKLAYTLSDRGTWLAMQDALPDLMVVVGGNSITENRDKVLLNPYGVIPVNPEKHPGVNFAMATAFSHWMTSPRVQKMIGGFGVDKFGQPLFYPSSEEYKATREVKVTIGDKTQTFSLDQLQAMPATTIADYEATGVKKGPLGKSTWIGVSLKDLLLAVDGALTNADNAGKLIVLTSSDGWTATIKWAELFGAVGGGEALYNVKGCNECHGVNGEGTAPTGKRPAPALTGKTWPAAAVSAILRAGKEAHAGINPYAEAQLSEDEIGQMVAWLADPNAPAGAYTVAAARQVAILAYQRDGKPATGVDGLLQLIVGWDEFAGRYSHWVNQIEVQ